MKSLMCKSVDEQLIIMSTGEDNLQIEQDNKRGCQLSGSRPGRHIYPKRSESSILG